MPPPMNPVCSHTRSYACESCGRCDLCCECPLERGGTLQHVDSMVIATRWRVLRIQAMDKEARNR